MPQTLLLNSTYEPISFLFERKAFNLIIKEKVEVLSYWENDYIVWGSGKSKYPAVVRMTYHVRSFHKKARFNRSGVLKRDQFTCQFCNKALTPSMITLEHLLPRSRGGNNSWQNCVCACFPCNNRKGNRTLEEAGMRLLSKPAVPLLSIANEYRAISYKHDSWRYYLNIDHHL
jgi:hypothetical protein